MFGLGYCLGVLGGGIVGSLFGRLGRRNMVFSGSIVFVSFMFV